MDKNFMRIFNKGFNFNQDGPGNRLVYHLSGCNLRCAWCANPECFSLENGKPITIDEIVKECISAKPMFFSGGGVTFTGGEATLYHSELLAALKALKENNIHTAIETNGTDENLSELLPFIDYLIMDFKHYDGDRLKKFTGSDNEVTKRNFEENCKNGRFQHIRILLINGVNADDPTGYTDYFTKFNTENTVFEFLSYHEYGKNKWTTPYKIENGFITKEILDNFIKTFKNHNLKIIKT